MVTVQTWNFSIENHRDEVLREAVASRRAFLPGLSSLVSWGRSLGGDAVYLGVLRALQSAVSRKETTLIERFVDQGTWPDDLPPGWQTWLDRHLAEAPEMSDERWMRVESLSRAI